MRYLPPVFLLLLGVLFCLYLLFSPAPESLPDSAERRPVWSCELSLGTGLHGEEAAGGARNFSAGEKIYARFLVRGLEPGPHRIDFRWYGPGGEERERYTQTLTSNGGTYRCRSWIVVTAGAGELFGDLWPFSGKLTGRWEVEASIDGTAAARKWFDVAPET
ncbi:MAG TPA: hypothetical protein PK636_03590 [bacterium]|nr:hypothetical protein [bacterium]